MNYWLIDSKVKFLNHGSFGACPLPVLEYQRHLQELVEKDPVRFFVQDLEPLLDNSRAILADFIGTQAQNLAFIANATTGVNAVLRSLSFQPLDEIIVTDHEYNACRNAVNFVAERWGATVIVAKIPFPLNSENQIIEAILTKVTPKTKLALISHVTSPTALVFPINQIVKELAYLGIDTLVDGAHAPGMLALNIEAINPAYYTGNCHKWLCAPKGAGFLYVSPDKQSLIRPLSISHGANSSRGDRSRFLVEFDWIGTDDPTPYLSIPEAIRFMGSLLPGGWDELMKKNRDTVLEARRVICQMLEIPNPCPDNAIAAMASIPLPINPYTTEQLQEKVRELGFQVPIIPWLPNPLIRISAQVYNSANQYLELGKMLEELLSAHLEET